MHDSLWYRPWEILARIGFAAGTGVFVWLRLPMAHTLPTLLVIVQVVLYLTLLVYPPRLRAILLCDQIEDRAHIAEGASVVVTVPPVELGLPRITIQVAELCGTAADKSARIRFARELAIARMRKIHDSFLISFVPIAMVVALTCVLSVLQQDLVNAGHVSPQGAFAIPFLQGLIGLIPFVWVVGQLLGEVTCHRDVVFKALG